MATQRSPAVRIAGLAAHYRRQGRHRGIAAFLWVAVALGSLAADEEVLIDDFEVDLPAARRTWQPQDATPPVSVIARAGPGKGRALGIVCPFTRDVPRSFVDRSVRLDLTHAVAVRLELLAERPEAVGRMDVFLRSGTGWYRGTCHEIRKGWQTVEIPRADFRGEERPAGWHAIDGIRLSPWKRTAVDTVVGVDRLRALIRRHSKIVIIAGSNVLARGGGEARQVETAAARMHELLTETGIPVKILDEVAMTRDGLKGSQVAVFPYNPSPTKQDLAAVARFVKGGGRILVFYCLDPGMAKILGVRKIRYVRGTYPGQFAEMRSTASGIIGMPKRIRQRSWNINDVKAVGKKARAVALWHDERGKRTPFPALVVSDAGVYMSHILLQDDLPAKRRMMLALIGRYVPGAWGWASDKALKDIWRIADADSRQGFRQRMQRRMALLGEGVPRAVEAARRMSRVEELAEQARGAVAEKGFLRGIGLAERAHSAAGEAWRLSHHPRQGEFRGVWCHDAEGPHGDWRKSAEQLAAAGFNALVPNMWRAGVADYPSRLLPVSETCRRKGDLVAQCVAAARQWGLEVHPWKVNWNLAGAPNAFVARMRREGRTQVNALGKPKNWLCPSHPLNFRMELESMLEVVRRYDVDGLHFDYIRYPGDQSCYCKGCCERFQKDTSHPVKRWPKDVLEGPLRGPYLSWRREQITRLVRQTSIEARKLKPHVTLSAAVFSNYPACRDSIGQDWVAWVREGYLDFVCPMNYIRSNARFKRTVADQVAYLAGHGPLYCGIGVALRYTLSPDQALRQIELARASGADGFVLFDYDSRLAKSHLPALGLAFEAPTFAPPHRAPRFLFDLPEASAGSGEPIRFPEGRPIRATVRYHSPGRQRKRITGVRARVEIEDVEGLQQRVLTEWADGRRAVQVSFVLPRGTWRLAVRGTSRYEDGSVKSFVVRSRPFSSEGAARQVPEAPER